MSAFYEGLAEILEISPADVSPVILLENHSWDSLAIVSTIALADDCFDVMLSGKALAECKTVADIENLIQLKKG